MRVTFDSNLWEKIVRPDRSAKDAGHNAQLNKINKAIKDGNIDAFVSDVVATLEAIKKVERAEFLSKQEVVPITRDITLNNGNSRRVVFAGSDQSHRPAMKPILTDRITEGYNLGIRFIKAPRFNEIAFPADYYAEEPNDFIDVWGRVEHNISARGVGKGLMREIAFKLGRKINGVQAYFDILNVPMTKEEEMEVSNAVAEWADGDAVASHVALRNDIFCTEDRGGKHGARKSILNSENRAWLVEDYNVVFATLNELAEKFT